MNSDKSVAIFWDYENCHAPSSVSGYELVNIIRSLAYNYGTVKLFKAYLAVPDQSSPRATSLRSELQSSGVSLTDCPHNGKKNVSDLMMVVDMMALAIDNPAPWTIILITGDGDFSYAASILRLRHYNIAVVCPASSHISLKSQANICFDWNADVMSKVNTTVAFSPPQPPSVPVPAPIPLMPFRSTGVHTDSMEVSSQAQLVQTTFVTTSVPAATPSQIPSTDPERHPVIPPSPPVVPIAKPPQRPSSTPVTQTRLPDTTTTTSNGWYSPPGSAQQEQATSSSTIQPARPILADPPPVYSRPTTAPVLGSIATTNMVVSISPMQGQGPTFGAMAAGLNVQTPPPGNKSISVQFLPLAQVLETYRRRKIFSPLRSVIATELAKDKKVYAGFPGNSRPFRAYSEAAKAAGIVCMGGIGGHAWISLHPGWHGKVP